MTKDLPDEFCSECPNCNGTGSHFDTPQYRPGGMVSHDMHSGKCRDCDGKGLSFTADGERIYRFVLALSNYPRARQSF